MQDIVAKWSTVIQSYLVTPVYSGSFTVAPLTSSKLLQTPPIIPVAHTIPSKLLQSSPLICWIPTSSQMKAVFKDANDNKNGVALHLQSFTKALPQPLPHRTPIR